MLLVNCVGILTSQILTSIFLICEVSLVNVPISWGYCEDCSESISPLEPRCWPFIIAWHVEGEVVGERGDQVLRVFVISVVLLHDAFFSSVLGNLFIRFWELVPIWVSFLVCSGSDPHFNPYLAVTEINWLGLLSKCRICACFASSLKFPPYPHFHYIPIYQPIKASY